MHIDYAAEALHRAKNPKHAEPFTDQQAVEMFAGEKDFFDLAAELSDEKISSIVETIRSNQKKQICKNNGKAKVCASKGTA